MRKELSSRFPGTTIGGIDQPDKPLDLLTGTYGTCSVAAIYGIPILYAQEKWPVCEQHYLSIDEIDRLEPPVLDTNPFFQNLLAQVDWIAKQQGRVEGYINWQGVLNNAWRLRGEALFYDLFDLPDNCRRLFDWSTWFRQNSTGNSSFLSISEWRKPSTVSAFTTAPGTPILIRMTMP